jgi:formylglycine-generating enzyme required for sulfatase activity
VSSRSDPSILIFEPAGERRLESRITIGAAQASVLVPASVTARLHVEWRDAVWIANTETPAEVRLNGRFLRTAESLATGDVLTIGAAQIQVRATSSQELQLDIYHLLGNDTIAPTTHLENVLQSDADNDLEIPAAKTSSVARKKSHRAPWVGLAIILGMFVAFFATLETVPLNLSPQDAKVTSNSLPVIRAGNSLKLFPGQYTVRVERTGYQSKTHSFNTNTPQEIAVRLLPLPGHLQVDTYGVPATLQVNGAARGTTPAALPLPRGNHTLLFTAPRYLPEVKTVQVKGLGITQQLAVRLRPAWGSLRVQVVPSTALISIDGQPPAAILNPLELPAGVRRIKLNASGYKSWESSVVIKSGELLTIGPVSLGQPDAEIAIRSQPVGAQVLIADSLRGRTPMTLSLPAGTRHDIRLTREGYADWQQTLEARPGQAIKIQAELVPVLGQVSIRGNPDGATVSVNGVTRGRAPLTLQLPAAPVQIEVSQAGFEKFVTSVAPVPKLSRVVEYRLVSSDRGQALRSSVPRIVTQNGYALELISGGTFSMGSERREQGRRPNEVRRNVSLKRPFYFGVTEITNAQFRQFRSAHASGYLGKQSLDLPQQAVTQVSWQDAAEYCNWLSAQEGLPTAYELRDRQWALKQPVTVGYRLPTEAEWEYAARATTNAQTSRFSWGDELPVPANIENWGGKEAVAILENELPGYQDAYVVIAPVAKFKANSLGLHDLAGNVSEWTHDFYSSFPDAAPTTDPVGPKEASRHVIRGANWKTTVVSDLRLAWRESAAGISSTIGFRVARYAE